MTTSGAIFFLGDGRDSLTGAHRGRGIFTTHSESLSEVKSSTIKSEKVISSTTQYEVYLVMDYADLQQALDLKACVTAPISVSNFTAEAALFKKAKLNKQTTSLLIKGRQVAYVQPIHSETKPSAAAIESLKKSPDNFVRAYGDEYICQVIYGKQILALVKLENTSKEEALLVKHSVEARLAATAGARAEAVAQSNHIIKHIVTDINIEYAGVEISLPSIASNIDGLFNFIDQFNKAKIVDAPIGIVSEPYATIIITREAAELSKQMNMVYGILSEYDKSYNKLRLLIPSIEKLVSGVRYLQLDDAVSTKNIEKLEEFLVSANYFKRLLEDLILVINSNQTNLTHIPEELSETITIKIPPPVVKSASLDEDAYYAALQKRQFSVRKQLNTILKLCNEKIVKMEAEVDMITNQLSAEIVRITSADDHVHLNLPPSGAMIRWYITKGNIQSFNIQIKDSQSYFSTYKNLFKRIAHGMETKLVVSPSHRLKFTSNDRGDYVIVGCLVGLQALDKSIPKRTTTWREKKWISQKEEVPHKGKNLIEYNPLIDYAKLEKLWLDEEPLGVHKDASPKSITLFKPTIAASLSLLQSDTEDAPSSQIIKEIKS